MKKYNLKSSPETSIELPKKPLELVVVELNGLIDFMDSEVIEYIRNSRSIYKVQTEDNEVKAKKGIEVARNSVNHYVSGRFYNAIEEEVIDGVVAASEKDPFLFLARYSTLKIYERLALFENPNILAQSIELFQQAFNFFEDGFNLGLALAYIEKKGKTNKQLDDCFEEKILNRDAEYSFLLSSLIYFSTDERNNDIVH